MHAIKGHWTGQVFAIATSNDTGGKKSRIRRSKEERKEMVETFIKKYQKTNYGNFPSLNLTHKEVGGSFYTVREIVREIIQENRVLAPPKISLEEFDDSGFLEQHPLGSIAMEPQSDFSVSENVHIMMNVAPNRYSVTNEEHISSSNQQSDHVELDNEQILNGINNLHRDTSIEEVSDSNPILHTPDSDHFVSEIIVNGGIVLEHNPNSDKAFTIDTSCIHEGENKNSLLPSPEIQFQGDQRLSDDQYVNQNDPVNKTKNSVQQTCADSVFMETMDAEHNGVKNVDDTQPVTSHLNSNVVESQLVVETFPLRPVSSTIHVVDGGSVKLHEADRTLEDKETQHVKVTSDRSFSDLVNDTMEKKLLDSTVELHVDSKDPLPDGTKVSTTIKQLISEESIVSGRKLSDEDRSSLLKGSNPTMDRINLETWERSSKNSARPESNPLVALVKTFVSAFVKFWTE